MNRIIIVPDVHGRTFWREVLKLDIEKYDIILFLGDYSDPYGYEGVTHEDALRELEYIVEFKKTNFDKVILLLGNHDCGYINEEMFASCRYSIWSKSKYEEFFVKQRNLFQIAYECKQNNQKYLFTHAGCFYPWMDQNIEHIKEGYPFGVTKISAEILNKEFEQNPWVFSQISRHRGGRLRFGSPIWADVDEHMPNGENAADGYYNIFGHSQQAEYPIITDNYACLDCRKVFVLENNELKEYTGVDEN